MNIRNTLYRNGTYLGVAVLTLSGLAAVALPSASAFAATSSTIDTNGDGYISTVEAQPYYGSIQASLTTSGDTSPASALALDRFPVADASGNLYYQNTITVSSTTAQAILDDQAVIVQHGIDLNGDGTYDGAATSSVDATVPLEATIPADCGVLDMTDGTSTGVATGTATLSSVNSPSSDAMGTAQVSLNGDQLTVTIQSSGLSPDLPHAQHIHIGGMNECPPSIATSSISASTTSQFTQALMNVRAMFPQYYQDLESFIADIGSGTMSSTTTGGSTSTTPPNTGGGTIDQVSSVRAGTSIDFTGRNFGHEESIAVTMNGATVGMAHADGGGNFSTGSLPVSNTPGEYTYVFTGQTSGITASTMVTVTS